MDFFEAFNDLEANTKSRRTLKNASNDLSITSENNNLEPETTSQQSQNAQDPDSSLMNFKDFTIFGSKMNMDFFGDNESEEENEDNASNFSHIDLLGGSSSLLNSVLTRINGKKEIATIAEEEETTERELFEPADDDEDDIEPTQPEINLDSEGLFDSMGGLSQAMHTDDFAKEKPVPKFNISKTILEEDEEEDDSNSQPINTSKAPEDKTQAYSQSITQNFAATLPVSSTVSIPETSLMEDDLEENEKSYDDDESAPIGKVTATATIAEDSEDDDDKIAQRVRHNTSLFVEEDEDDEDDDIVQKPRKHNPLFVEDDNESEDEIEAGKERHAVDVGIIEGYKEMTREEKIQARIAEKKRLRDLEEQLNDINKDLSDVEMNDQVSDERYHSDTESKVTRKLSKKQLLAKEMKETVEINELKKKDYYFIMKSNKSKFQASNIDNFFDDSDAEDDRLFSAEVEVEESPLSSPVKNIVSPVKAEKPNKHIPLSGPLKEYAESAIKIRNKTEKVVILDNDSSDSDIDRKKASKVKKFDLQRKFSIKHRKATLSGAHTLKSGVVASDATLSTSTISAKDLKATIRHRLILQHSETARSKQSQRKEADLIRKEELDVIKLLQEERKRTSMIRQKEKELALAKKMAKSAKSNIEDGESSDGESSSEESESDSEEEAELEDAETAVIKSTEGIQIEQEEVSYDLDEVEGGNGFNVMSLSDAFGLTLPENNSFDGLKGVEVAKKLREIENRKGLVDVSMTFNESEMEEDSFDQDTSNADNSNILSKLSFTADEESENDADDEEADNKVMNATQRQHRLLDSQNFLPDTQADSQTQKLSRSSSLTQNDVNDDNQEESQDEEDDEDEAIKKTTRKRRLVNRMESIVEEDDNEQQVSSSDEEVYADEDEDEDEESEENKRMRIQMIKDIRKKEEAARRKREKEKRSKGLNTVMDQEAVESEDEWQGIGGKDGERSDQMDSEDEKMLDDGSLINVDEDQIRKYLNEENIDLDDKMVKKIMYDWKAGNFRNRRARDGAYELDSSDDEGTNNLRRLVERSRRQLQEAKSAQTTADESLAFYKVMHESATSFKLDDNDAEFGFPLDLDDDRESKVPDEKENEDPFRVSKRSRPEEVEEEGEIVFEVPEACPSASAAPPVKKKARLSAEAVGKALSFLNETDGSPVRAYEGFSFNDHDQDGTEAIKQLKQNSIIRSSVSSFSTISIRKDNQTSSARSLVAKKHTHRAKTNFETIDSEEEVESTTGPQIVDVDSIDNQEAIQLDDDDDNHEDMELDMGMGLGMLAARGKSITSSFKKFNSAKSKEVRTGTSTGSSKKVVNVTTSSKPVFGSRSSVTYLTKGLSPSIVMGTKNSVIQESLKLSHKGKRLEGLHRNSSFK